MITSKINLIKYIRLRLGEPLISVELTDEHIAMCIDDTIAYFTSMMYGDFDTEEYLETSDLTGRTVKLQMSNVYAVKDGNGGKRDIPFHFDNIRRILTFKGDIPKEVIILGAMEYRQDDNDDPIFNHEWIKNYSLAYSKFTWGTILGKYSHELVGGASINYDRLISEGQDEMEKLKEELMERWMDPAPVLIG